MQFIEGKNEETVTTVTPLRSVKLKLLGLLAIWDVVVVSEKSKFTDVTASLEVIIPKGFD